MGWQTQGHADAKRFLAHSLATGKLAHAHMISGPQGVGRATMGLDIAKLLNCSAQTQLASRNFVDGACGACSSCERIDRGLHADLRVLGVGERQRVGVEQVAELSRSAALKPFEGQKRVFIVKNAERLSAEAANALLKTLEEPGDHVALVLVAPTPEALPATLVSRCRRIDLKPLSETEIDKLILSLPEGPNLSATDATLLRRVARGRPGYVFRALRDGAWLEHAKQAIQRVSGLPQGGLRHRLKIAADLAQAWRGGYARLQNELDLWIGFWRSEMERATTQEAVATAVVNWDITARALTELESNANPRLTLETLTLGIWFQDSPQSE